MSTEESTDSEGTLVKLRVIIEGSIIEKIPSGLTTTVRPVYEEELEQVGGRGGLILVKSDDFPSNKMDDLMYQKTHGGVIMVEGNYVPNPRGDYIGDLQASAFEF